MIVAVDFDGTIVTNKYPNIGEVNSRTVAYLKKMKSKGVKLILWTCRSGSHLTEAVEFCEGQGIQFDAVNDNLPEIKEKYGNNSRKIFADFYIDDRAFIPVEVYNEFMKPEQKVETDEDLGLNFN